MRPETWVFAGGVLTAAFAVFHLLFWKLFRWKTELAKLTALNRAVMQILNLCLAFAFVVFAYVSLAHAAELVATPLGRSLLALISAFWLLRAIEQVVFFGLRTTLSIAFFVVFLVGCGLYAMPLI